jgi:hypothetical protein
MANSRTPEELFWQKVDKSPGQGPAGDCWQWTAFKTKTGYGKLTIHKEQWLAHRYSYQLANGAPKEGLYILHSCDNPSCVNPAHLRAGTQQENVADMDARNRRPAMHIGRIKPELVGSMPTPGLNAEKPVTMWVTGETREAFKYVASITGEKIYQVADRLAREEHAKVFGPDSKRF